MEGDDYLAEMKTHQTKKEKWDENRPRTYNLVLQHCPPKLETRLTSQWLIVAATAHEHIVVILLTAL